MHPRETFGLSSNESVRAVLLMADGAVKTMEKPDITGSGDETCSSKASWGL
ncbi:MAG TPA: hypothetical protein VN372_09060 [Methanospirillum sp.]|nr:hypothetical protein [Methanospirillum sp.]